VQVQESLVMQEAAQWSLVAQESLDLLVLYTKVHYQWQCLLSSWQLLLLRKSRKLVDHH
jgi:hypothetical protein